MMPPDINASFRIRRAKEKTAAFSISTLEKSFYLPGHGEVSEAGPLPREKPGTFPFDMEDEVFVQSFKAFFS